MGRRLARWRVGLAGLVRTFRSGGQLDFATTSTTGRTAYAAIPGSGSQSGWSVAAPVSSPGWKCPSPRPAAALLVDQKAGI